MDYLSWNNAIGARFFNPDKSGTRVFLYVTSDVINEIGSPHRSGVEDFTRAVKVGPPWITRHGQSICQQALQALENWRIRDIEYPSYLAYLALFVLADTVNVGFARHSYYPGLRSLLGEEIQTGTYPSFHQMYRLWDDLAVWSNQDKHGEWGIFDADIVGEWMHVGLPRAQTLLTEEERENLPFLFGDSGFDPYSPPSDQELAYLLSNDPFRRLRRRTNALLRSTPDNDRPARVALIEVLLDELLHWDGSAPPREDSVEQTRSSLGNLRLTMVFDPTARTARTGLRCRSNREYPEEGLQLVGDGVPGALYSFEDWQGWSTLLTADEAQTRGFDASQIDWRNGLVLWDRVHAWRTLLPKRSIRVMTRAESYGFDGFVEESQLPSGKSFCLLVHETLADDLQRWGVKSCDGFRQVDLLSGLPAGWQLYSIGRANSDAIIREVCPSLAFPQTMRIQLRGGLRIRGNQYFSFALPRIEVTGTSEEIEVYCNDYPLARDQSTGLWELPGSLQAHRLVIEARLANECIYRKSLYTIDTADWREIPAAAYLDRFGLHSGDESQCACYGPVVHGFTPPGFFPEIFLPPGAGNRVFYVGRNPGEIAVSPAEPMPRGWSPVWAIPMRKRGCAVYCATELDASAPTTNPCSDRRRVGKWKEVLWHNRKRIEPPRHPAVFRLWKAYQEAAHRVR